MWRGTAGYGKARCGRVRHPRGFWFGRARLGAVRSGLVRHGMVGLGTVGHPRGFVVRQGEARQGRARLGMVGFGMVGHPKGFEVGQVDILELFFSIINALIELVRDLFDNLDGTPG